VGSRKVDASEYAFYLYYNRTNSGAETGTVLYDAAATQMSREIALEQIITNEVVRLKCEEFGLELSEAQKTTLELNKERLIEALGGKAAYLNYLKQTHLTDRAYDKFQSNAYYYDLLYTHMALESKADFTDEKLRQYFSAHYATVKYIYLGLLDEEGEPLDKELRAEQTALAESILEQLETGAADFDTLMAQYNEDISMTSGGFAISEPEARSTDYLSILFDLEENQVSDLLTMSDGYYILQRLGIAANYYDEHLDTIFHDALDTRFSQFLQQARDEYGVAITPDYRKLELDDLARYVH
jgi:parvulin-like peptidyl-prolyl isomerase